MGRPRKSLELPIEGRRLGMGAFGRAGKAIDRLYGTGTGTGSDMLERLRDDPGSRTLGQLLQERQWALQEIERLSAEVLRLGSPSAGKTMDGETVTATEAARRARASKSKPPDSDEGAATDAGAGPLNNLQDDGGGALPALHSHGRTDDCLAAG